MHHNDNEVTSSDESDVSNLRDHFTPGRPNVSGHFWSGGNTPLGTPSRFARTVMRKNLIEKWRERDIAQKAHPEP